MRWEDLYRDPVAEGKVGHDLQTRIRLTFEEAAKGVKKTIRLRDVPAFDVDIPPGVMSGQHMQADGKGAPARNKDGVPGNLMMEFQVERHPIFTRSNWDILMTKSVDLVYALLGTVIRVPTLDGVVDITLRPGTQHGAAVRVGNKGISQGLLGHANRRGDQIVQIEVALPRELTQRQRELLEEFRKEEYQKSEALKQKAA
jgi:DnaJ-class molecular chaperone